jgi:hypothetical protein
MTAAFRRDTADRKAQAWEKQLAPFDRLEFAVSDAAKGIGSALTQIARARRDDPKAPALEHGPDVFHTVMEARRVLARGWRRVEAAWEKAEAADLEVDRSKRQGIDARGVARSAQVAWGRARALSEQGERLQAAWRRAQAGLELFRADGQLNDRGHARAEIAEALKGLTGPDRSLPGPGPGFAHLRLPDAAPGRSEGTDAKTVNGSKCEMRQCLNYPPRDYRRCNTRLGRRSRPSAKG